MRVFVTGATGFIGSALVPELIAAGHRVVGLARSDRSVAALADAGAEAHRGSLDDPDGLASGAAAADGVIHCAFNHDFVKAGDFSIFAVACATEHRAVEAMGAALAGSGRPLVITSGTATLAGLGRVAAEDDADDPGSTPNPRARTAQLAIELADRGVRSAVLRLPPSVHGDGDQGFIPEIIKVARAKGVSAYIGDGANRWPAVHRLDAARLFRLAVERAPAGSRLHAVGDEGVPTRAIAEAIGRGLGLPVVAVPAEQAADHFGWIAHFFGLDNPTSAALTREQLGWSTAQPGLIEDLDRGTYFAG